MLENKALGVDESGVVVWIEDGGIGGIGEEVVRNGEVWRVVRGGSGGDEWWFPGFVGA